MAGFAFKKNRAGRNTGITDTAIIANSATITKGAAVKIASGFAALAANGGRVYGIVTGFQDRFGAPLASPHADHDGTYTEGGVGVEKYVATSDNQTDKQVYVVIDTDLESVWSVAPDAAIGTTTGSNLKGYYTDIPAASLLTDEDTASATVGQFFILGVDPDNTANQLVVIAEPQKLGYAQA